MKKRIVFHFYYNLSDSNNIMYEVHKIGLSRYSKLFDDAVFNIVLDNVDDDASFLSAKQFIYNCGFSKDKTKFLRTLNDENFDAKTFYNCVVQNLGEYDGITFFGHTKGTKNAKQSNINIENIVYWVMAMYFFNLENIVNFENSNQLAYLNPLVNNSDYIQEFNVKGQPKYGYYPIGTFFLIKDKALKEYITSNNIEIPPMLERGYAEKFIGNILPFNFDLISTSNIRYGMNMTNFYTSGKKWIELLYDVEDRWGEFVSLCQQIIDDRPNKTANMIYIVTDKYKNYAENFISTIKLFLPGWEKWVTILTDDIGMIENITNRYTEQNIHFEFYKVPGNCPYPCVNLSKYAYVNAFMCKDCDYVFYFDSDTYFIERPESTWKKLFLTLEQDKIVMGYHPCTMNDIVGNTNEGWIRISRDHCDERNVSELYDDLSVKDDDHIWVISSFFAAKTDIMARFLLSANKKVTDFMRGPKVSYIPKYRVPRLFDETVANRMICDFYIGKDNSIKYDIDFYLIGAEGYDSLLPNILFIQKYMTQENYKNHE